MFNLKEQQQTISDLALILMHSLNISDHPFVSHMLGFPEAKNTHNALCCWLVEHHFIRAVNYQEIMEIYNALEAYLMDQEVQIMFRKSGGEES